MTKQHPLVSVRRAGVPLVAWETSDPAATVLSCVKALGREADIAPVVEWDCVAGQRARTNSAAAMKSSFGDKPIKILEVFLQNLDKQAKSVVAAEKTVATDALVFVHNAHLFIRNEGVIQALWNLRDTLKAVSATVVLLCPSITLPAELQNDVVVITEPLPDADEVGAIVDTIAKDAGLKKVEDRAKVVDTLLGVSAFAAEQAFAMSITDKGVDREALWDRKRKMVEQTPGLTVFKSGETFDDIGGCDNVKSYLTGLLRSERNPVRCIGFLDEVEKMFAGSKGDLSGVSQDQMMVFLREMQDSNIPGIIFIGPPGTAKSAVSKACGSIADAEVLAIDTGAMTDKYVGESQARVRKAMATFKAVSQGKGLFIATCNKIAVLPPELRRRFTLGTFFFDLPDKTERKAIWKIWMTKYGFDEDTLKPEDEGWTGAEVKACCDIAWRTKKSLLDAAKFVVPVSKSAADSIESLRQMASGRFISASKEGIYEHIAGAVPTGRAIKVTQTLVAEEMQNKSEQE